MARPLRVEYPGAFYHVINRGNAGAAVFKSIRDREKFLEYLGKAAKRFSIRIHTYCLMTNHYHLLVETPDPNLSRAIQWINVSYATYFNRKRDRRGHLFKGRFKSILIDADEYLKHLSRYIHLNPVRAKMIDRPSGYLWSSYPAFTGGEKPPCWLETDWLLSQFGKKRKDAEKNYRCFVEDVEIEAIDNPSDSVVGGFILGAPDFVNWVKDTFLRPRSDVKEIPQLRQLKPAISIETVIEAVCSEFGCDAESVIQKGRKNNRARDIAIYLARDLTGRMAVRLGEYFGNISGPAITLRYQHMAKQKANSKNIDRQVAKIRRIVLNNY